MGYLGTLSNKLTPPLPEDALSGRTEPIVVSEPHAVLGSSLMPDYPLGTSRAVFGMGCFWGAERLFWQQPGVYTTAVGYSAGYTPNPRYEDVCTGLTGHSEVVLVVFWPTEIRYEALLKLFWESHNPTQGMRQANDLGTQYRSGIYWFDEMQRRQAEESYRLYQLRLQESGAGEITTELKAAADFYFAEAYHQQYLAKNPTGYCDLQTRDKTGLPPVSA